MRRLALQLPEAVESAHFSVADVRVRNKIFVALPDGDRTIVVKTTPANLDALVAFDAETFGDEWRRRWLRVRLDRVTLPLLRDLLAEAWRLVAPKRLTPALKQSRGGARRLTSA